MKSSTLFVEPPPAAEPGARAAARPSSRTRLRDWARPASAQLQAAEAYFRRPIRSATPDPSSLHRKAGSRARLA